MATLRYIVNNEPMDIEAVNIPPHIGVRDSGLGYGSRCLIVECGGVAVDDGVKAFRAVYPELRATAEKEEAARLCQLKWITPHKGGRTIKKSTDVTPEIDAMLAELYQQHGISLGDIVDDAVRLKHKTVTAG